MTRPRGASTFGPCAAVALSLLAGAAHARQQTQAPAAPWARTSYLYTELSNVFDNNIEHEPVALNSYGVLFGVGGQYQGRFAQTSVDLEYDGVFRRYTGTDLWNRPGHVASASLTQRLARHWAVGVDGEVAINGSAEDLVLRNEYSVKPQLECRFNRATRLVLYGEYLLKRYPDPLLGQNAVDPRVGVRFRQTRDGGDGWGVSGRYEYNRADSTRHRWVGWSAGMDAANSVSARGRMAGSVRYRVRHYTSRLVRVGHTRVLRRDQDAVATLGWQQVVWGPWSVGLSYRFEAYVSNDPDKRFEDHRVGITLQRWW